MKIRFILYGIGGVFAFNTLLMLITALVSWGYDEPVFAELLYASLLSGILGVPFLVFFRNYDAQIGKKEGYLLVVLGWLFLILSGTFPFLFTGVVHSFTDAFFESTSGYTTTGATIMTDIEALPKGILFWRSLTHWVGGMGIIVLVIAILPLLGIGGTQLFWAEAPGIKMGKLHPRITQTAKILWGIYVFFTLLQTLLLTMAGMSFFDALNHAFSTLATGGFSTKNQSLAYWNDNPAVQYIIIFFMFIAGSNFVLSYFFVKRRFSDIWKDDEFRWYLKIVVSVSLLVACILLVNTYFSVGSDSLGSKAEVHFRHAIFQVLSVITTTGFTTSNYTLWGDFLKMAIFSLMFLGACAGSTSGGIKVVRHLLMARNGLLEFKRTLHPSAIIPTRLNARAVSRNIMYNILGFFILYMMLFTFGTLVLGALGNDFETALGTSAASLGNVGISLGKLNPEATWQELSFMSKWVSVFLMFVGRLELFTVLIIFTPYFWRRI